MYLGSLGAANFSRERLKPCGTTKEAYLPAYLRYLPRYVSVRFNRSFVRPEIIDIITLLKKHACQAIS